MRHYRLSVLYSCCLLASCVFMTGCSEPNNGTSGSSNNGTTSASNNGTMTHGQTTGMETEEVVPDGALTYWTDVRPILDEHCVTCHDGGGVAPFDWTDPEQTKALGELLANSVASGTMPPWYPADECSPVQGDLRLSEEKITAIGTWVSDGKYIGDPDTYESVPPIPADINTERLADEIEMELRPTEAYEVPTEFGDYFRCFTIDPGFETTRHMGGFEAIIDNVEAVHHMIIFAVGSDASTEQRLADLEAEDAAPGFDCFGSPGVGDLRVAGAWAPGGGVVGFPPRTALPMEAGTKFVLQMHYNVAAEASSQPTDRSGARIWLLPEGSTPLGEGELVFVGNLPFEIPAGVNGLDVPVEDCDRVYGIDNGTLPPARGVDARDAAANRSLVGQSGCVIQEVYYKSPVPVRIWSVFPHMHLKGDSIKVEVMPFEEDGENAVPLEDSMACAMDMPRWDFNWQRAYWLEEPIRAPANGMVRLTCRYDNSDETVPAGLGDGSGDEMCLALFYLSL